MHTKQIIVIAVCLVWNGRPARTEPPRVSHAHLERHSNLTYIYDHYNETPGFHHWTEYGAYYQHNIQHLLRLQAAGQVIKMLEMGVQSGGSSRLWRLYFGQAMQYVGIDINPACQQFQNTREGTYIKIGSQLNTTFLQDVCDSHGPFHLIVDDGGHTTQTIMTSLNVLWMCLHDAGVYAIEDLHTMTLLRGRTNMLIDGRDVFGHLADIMRDMHEYSYSHPNASAAPGNNFTRHLSQVRVYDSMVFLHWRAQWKPLTEFRRGRAFIGYGEGSIWKQTQAVPANTSSKAPSSATAADISRQDLLTLCLRKFANLSARTAPGAGRLQGLALAAHAKALEAQVLDLTARVQALEAVLPSGQ